MHGIQDSMGHTESGNYDMVNTAFGSDRGIPQGSIWF